MSWKKFPWSDEVAVLSDVVPNTIEPDDAPSAGVAGLASRQDHEHGIVAAQPTGAVAESAAAAEGTGTSFVREDHVHQCPATWAPSGHVASHKSGGGDEIDLDELGVPTGSVDFDDQQAVKLRLEAAAAWSGAVPADGAIFFDTDDDHVYVYVA